MNSIRHHRSILPFAYSQHKQSIELSGSIHIFMLGILLVVFVVGGGYLYAVNQSAVQGYHMRTLEKEIGTLKQENTKLKIVEADLRSLYRIEVSEEVLTMHKLDTAVYLEGRALVSSKSNGTIALK